MKNLRSFCLLVVAATLLAVALPASAQTKIASVDMTKVFNGYYKKKMAQAAIDQDKMDLSKEIKDMSDGLEKARTDYKNMLEQANDPAISADERDRRKLAADDAAKDVNSRQVAIEQYSRQAEAQLTDKSQRMISNLVGEIQKAVADKAKAGGYTMVFDSSPNGASGVPSVLYYDPSTDITAEVLTELNAGAPIDVTRPAGGLLSTNAP